MRGSPDIWSNFSEEQLLTNIMLYVAPSSVVTATWIYHGKRLWRQLEPFAGEKRDEAEALQSEMAFYG